MPVIFGGVIITDYWVKMHGGTGGGIGGAVGDGPKDPWEVHVIKLLFRYDL